MIYDIFTFNGEYDLLEIRLNVLNEYVDKFIIIEANETFSGLPKPLYYVEQKERYEEWENKIEYYVVDDYPHDERILAMAHESPYTKGADHWKREFYQKESIQKALSQFGLKRKDICFIGDVDEIWDTEVDYSPHLILGPTKLLLKVYTYYLNNRSTELFHGNIVSFYKDLKDKCLNESRNNPSTKSGHHSGWHFTSMGGLEELKRKLSDSYTADSYWNPIVQATLEHNYINSKDFLGRNFTYWVDESEWPKYLKDHKKEYTHLCK